MKGESRWLTLHYFRLPGSLSNSRSQSRDGTIGRDYASVERIARARPLRQPRGASGSAHDVTGCHSIAGLGRKAPSVGYG
jgi:hypothetical protein